MRLIKRYQSTGRITILAAGLMVLVLMPLNAMALPECTIPADNLCSPTTNPVYNFGGDCDGDGITDMDECEGFTTASAFGLPLDVTGYTSGGDINPTKADLFYAVTSADAPFTEIDQMSLSHILGALGNPDYLEDALFFYAGGVPVTTHRIKLRNSGALRVLFPSTSDSKARLVWIKESLCPDCDGSYVGYTEQGVPSDPDVNTTIYSQKIIDSVDAAYSRYGGVSVAGTVLDTPEDVADYWLLQLIAHEVGHGSNLVAPPDGSAKSYYHYRDKSLIMAPSVSFSKGTYSIPVAFNPQDAGTAQLVR